MDASGPIRAGAGLPRFVVNFKRKRRQASVVRGDAQLVRVVLRPKEWLHRVRVLVDVIGGIPVTPAGHIEQVLQGDGIPPPGARTAGHVMRNDRVIEAPARLETMTRRYTEEAHAHAAADQEGDRRGQRYGDDGEPAHRS